MIYNSLMDSLFSTLTKARKALKLSQADLSQKLGIQQGHISRVEQGKVDIRLSNLQEWARILGLEVILIPKQLQPMIHQMLTGQEDDAPSLPELLLEEDA